MTDKQKKVLDAYFDFSEREYECAPEEMAADVDLSELGIMYSTFDSWNDGEEHGVQWTLDITKETPELRLYLDDRPDPIVVETYSIDELPELIEDWDFDCLYYEACHYSRIFLGEK